MVNATTAKIGLQVIGTLASLSCLWLFGRAYVLAYNREWAGLVLVVILGVYFAYVGYLTWLRFSPRAVRNMPRSYLPTPNGTINAP